MKTSEQINAWKKEFGRINQLDTEDGTTLYFKGPNRKELKLIMAKARQGGVEYAEAFVKNCFLGGDIKVEEILNPENTFYLSEIAASVDDLINLKKATVKKL